MELKENRECKNCVFVDTIRKYQEAGEEAYEEGKKLGILEGEIRGTIRMCKDFHISTEEILKKLMKKFSLIREKAEMYMKEEHME